MNIDKEFTKMNFSKKFIGRVFFFFSFIGAMLMTYIQIASAKYPAAYLTIITWVYAFVWIGLMASGYLLMNYINQNANTSENKTKS